MAERYTCTDTQESRRGPQLSGRGWRRRRRSALDATKRGRKEADTGAGQQPNSHGGKFHLEDEPRRAHRRTGCQVGQNITVNAVGRHHEKQNKRQDRSENPGPTGFSALGVCRRRMSRKRERRRERKKGYLMSPTLRGLLFSSPGALQTTTILPGWTRPKGGRERKHDQDKSCR